jgi:hypothetical protein
MRRVWRRIRVGVAFTASFIGSYVLLAYVTGQVK